MRARRRRSAAVLTGLVVLVAVVVALTTAPSHGAPATKGQRGHAGANAGQGAGAETPAALTSRRPSGPAAVEAGLYPWTLQAPISRETVAPGSAAGQVVIAGGLTSAGASDSGVYTLATSNGSLHLAASLPVATHDAAGGRVGADLYMFGGGAAAPSGASQRVVGASAGLLGQLPAARADASALTIGTTMYLVGGYDGASMEPQVLATSNGASFHAVARLPVPVRYPAVAALGAELYVFGGQGASGTPVSDVQLVDTRTGAARVVGQLPLPRSGATAADLGGTIYLAGGLQGAAHAAPTASVLAWNARTHRFLRAGSLPIAVSNAGAAVTGGRLVIVGGETAGSAPTRDVQFVRPDRAFGLAGSAGAGSPYYGDQLLIADRGNNRLLVLDDTGKVIWQYPSASMPAPPGGFYYPDDAFFVDHGHRIIINQEDNETIVELAYPSGKVLWQYGHPHQPGSTPGYLDNPDDAYLMRNGDISVADTKNCRVLVIDPATKTVLHQIGSPGGCQHQPPTYLGSPNGDTPLADGNLLISEINGSWIDEYTQSGRLVWSVALPIGYPSDPQDLGGGRYLVVDYEHPGAIVEFTKSAQVLYRYQVSSGPGELNQPSLGELLPSGVFLLNDDYNDRMVAIDPATGALIWQYGQNGVPGTAPGMLDVPDGFDILGPGGTTPTHTATA